MITVFETIVTHMTDGLVLTNPEGKVVFANDAAQKMLLDPEVAKILSQAPQIAIKDLPLNQEIESIQSSTSTHWYQIKISLWKGNEGKQKGLFFTIVDLTEQRLEEKRREYFLGIAGHEIKNPLATIRAISQTLERRCVKEGKEDALLSLQKIIGRVDLITHLINELMDITRLRTGNLEYFNEVFAFESFLAETLAEFQRMFPQHVLERAGKVDGYIETDRIRLKQALLNLLTNAAKHTPQTLPITLTATGTPEAIELLISDHGPVISGDDRKQIFELQYQSPSGEPAKRPGLGLGLYISRMILEHYGGHIWVEDGSEGKGNIFRFSLPRRPQKK